MTSATLRDHLVAQGSDAETYIRGARVHKRAGASAEKTEATEFMPVRVESTPQPATAVTCRIKHASGLVLEFEQWPEPTWLAALLGATSSASR